MYTRIFRVVFGPVGEFKSLRAQIAPVNLQGIQILFLGKFHHNPGRIIRIEDFAPPHRLHVVVGQMAPADKTVVVLGGTAVNRLAQEPARPFLFVGNPQAGAVVLADSVPVVIIGKRAVREAEYGIAAVHQRLRHVVIAAGWIPDGKVGSHHVLLVDYDARFQVIDRHHVLRGKRATGRRTQGRSDQIFFNCISKHIYLGD